ncbi:PREDICTED: olfactory receptor 7A10-like [Myotis davidii]|uniref:olfactory receptor 7A10-like n=1 Tax=Myotis davidii TaxID=225400 RepID=UPI0003EC5995|nr:PREDICTED: olfactory receptor 7A10-like [Myotis davidii]
MESENQTDVAEFLLVGLSEDPELQPLLFGLFMTMYLVTVLGNLLIILGVSSDCHLHTPMYFFLSNLSFVDICFTSTIVPKMLVNIQTGNKAITYAGCLTQVYFFLFFMCMDNLLLTVMAYDRYVAICHPLYYTVIMNPCRCGLLVLLSLLISFINALLPSLMESWESHQLVESGGKPGCSPYTHWIASSSPLFLRNIPLGYQPKIPFIPESADT